MRIIRGNVFETNSSSLHTLCLVPKGEDKINIPNLKGQTITVSFGKFGWFGDCNNWEEKFAYLVQLIWCYLPYNVDADIWCPNNQKEWKAAVRQITETDDYKRLEEIVKDATGAEEIEWIGNGYIDHQSYENYKSLDEWLDSKRLNDDAKIQDFIFGKSFIKISNDNC